MRATTPARGRCAPATARPSPQVLSVVGPDSALSERAQSATMKACFALMLGFEHPIETRFDAARVLEADISWISVNSSKPGRSDDFALLVHATNAWADANLELDLDERQVLTLDGAKLRREVGQVRAAIQAALAAPAS